MKTVCFLVFTRRGVVRTTKSSPRLRQGECAVRLRVDIPDSVFAPPFFPDVTLTVPEETIVVPSVTAEPMPVVVYQNGDQGV